MKRILILTACALLLLPFNEAKAAPVPSSPVAVTVNDGDPLDQILGLLGELKVIKEELIAIKADQTKPKRFVDQAALDAAAKALVILIQLKDVQDNYGDVPVSESERTKLIDFLVQNYEVLHDKPVTNEAAEELYKAIGKYNTIGELIDGLVLEL